MPLQSSSQKLPNNHHPKNKRQQSTVRNLQTATKLQQKTQEQLHHVKPIQRDNPPKKKLPKGLDLRPPKKCHPPRHHPAGDADIFAPHGIAHRQHVGVQVRYLFTELDGAQSLGGWGRGGRGWGRNWGERSKVKSLGFHEVEVEALGMIALPLPRPLKKVWIGEKK